MNLLVPSLLLALVGQSPSPRIVAEKLAADYQSAVQGQRFSTFANGLTPGFAYFDAKGRRMPRAAFLKRFERLYRGMALQTFRVTSSSAKKARDGILFTRDTKVVGMSTLGGPKANFYKADARDEVMAVYRGVDGW